ncbi:P-loop containing nucleoside triphosphate hydrolase protein [Byssothecium circinans]|uniref:P-loop containing nucleoside triphosphate hydrolase protein n=1 Tax=Byssothecium circinans TaxID=147558 RepID=A0A6A5U1D4_9PLEO|nr:P-loop containing nucleoside triphosphate hydrolase protein [Byssothecium circinans]
MPLEERKHVHPFFSRPQKLSVPEPKEPAAEPSIEEPRDDPDYELKGNSAQKGSRKRGRKPGSKHKDKIENGAGKKKQPSLEQFSHRLNGAHTADGEVKEQDEALQSSLGEDPNQSRRKRRKSASPVGTVEALDWQQQLQNEIDKAQPQPGTEPEVLKRPMTPPNAVPEDAVPETTIVRSQPKKTTPKKKVLKVNKNGKLLSSPPAKPEPKPATPKKRRMRKTSKTKAPSTATVIKYGHDAASRKAIGEKIDVLLNDKKIARRSTTPKKQALPLPKPSGPPKSTHPFFLGKVEKRKDDHASAASSTPQPSPRAQRKSPVTPGKLRAESRCRPSDAPMPACLGHARNREPKSTGLRETPLTKTLARQLHSSMHEPDGVHSTDFKPPQDVRLPTRLLTTGISIQDKVRDQGPNSTHPAIQTLFLDIERTLTPFDLGKCEIQSWTSKYAPKRASHVLQPGEEAMVLYDWLTSLTVMAVEGKDGGPKIADVKKPPKKKRKKAEDDFIVDSDEEEEEDMIQLNAEDHGKSNTGSGSTRRQRWTRNKNVVIVTGPSGCGKSAMVHAVAKDLGFEVFEINSGTRRSGKDIQDKVGDMSENHLVNHKRNEKSNQQDVVSPEDTDIERHNEALEKDIASGRQSTMASFFKAKGPMDSKSKAKSKVKEPRKAATSTQGTLPITQDQRNSQKQSLILFEEADILFEEDQQFWTHVTKLASQSKRPIVITCNDETSIPMHGLSLGAVLRLSPPPIDLATDYMLVLAGREGHILKREAISSLYESKGHDLRASITELDLWCQMSVGDRKGGLEWMYQRWPPGKDIDEQGRLFRVASEDTYFPGMGNLSYNVFTTSNNIAFDKQHELLKEAWQDWGLNPSDWAGEGREKELSTSFDPNSLKTLELLDAMSDSISAADSYCRIDLPSYGQAYNQPIDPTLPPLREKDLLSYTSSAPVIQTDYITDFTNFDTDAFIQSHLLINRVYGGLRTSSGGIHALATTEAGFNEAILKHKQHALTKPSLSRPDFSDTFDILAYLPDTLPAMNTSYNLTASSFDRTFSVVVEDVAPYVRSIVAHELALEAQRLRLGNLLSEGGKTGTKRVRTTRAARTAMEGGERKTKRRERWFEDLNRTLVMQTAGSWAGMGSVVSTVSEGSEKTSDSLPTSREIQGS